MLGQVLARFLGHARIDHVLTVIADGDEGAYGAVVAGVGAAWRPRLLASVTGGATRQASVANGLDALAALAPARVLIHDAARPFVSDATIDAVIDGLDGHEGAVPVVAMVDTIKRLDGGLIAGTLDRSTLGRAQTPQGFSFAAIHDAHRRAQAEGLDAFTDDAAVGEWAGLRIATVAGDPANTKITTAADLAAARERFTGPAVAAAIRVGLGFDVHAFGPGHTVRLCGIDIEHDRGLKGHSDADVALHALCDALYGAIGAGDIGHHFPPSDPEWAGADSAMFLAHARDLVAGAGGSIVHVDLTIICERPKIGPHREAMVARLAELLRIPPAGVSVKATTTERLGFAGRGEGIAAQAAATVAVARNEGESL